MLIKYNNNNNNNIYRGSPTRQGGFQWGPQSMEQVRWANEELKTFDKMTRKVLTMKGAFHSKRDVDWLYVSREDGGRAD